MKLIATVVQIGKRWLGRSLQMFLGGILLFLALGLASCANQPQSVRILELPDVANSGEVRLLSRRRNGKINEVAVPAIFLDLADLMLDQQPQVEIAYPQQNQVIESTSLTVKLKLSGLSIYREDTTNLGPHLQLILDNQPAQSIYTLDEPVELTDLAPGSHTLRVLAVKPWGESFKNESAYAQTSFHIYANTGENIPDSTAPLLTYSEPQGKYGAEPILLDFYLKNVPLHIIAQDDPTLADWKLRCDINGQSFVFDQWQPIYLKGFKPGKNWVQLTLVDEQDHPIENAFNSTVRVIDYEPEKRDALAKLTRGELQLKDVGQIADPNYIPPPEPVIEPEPEPEPVIEPEPEPVIEPKQEAPDAFSPNPAIDGPSANAQPQSEAEAELESDTQPEAAIEPDEAETEPESDIQPEAAIEPSAEKKFEVTDELEAIENRAIDQESVSEPSTQDRPSSEDDFAVEPAKADQTETVKKQADAAPNVLERVQTFWNTLTQSEPEQIPQIKDSTAAEATKQDEPFSEPAIDEPAVDESAIDEPAINNTTTDNSAIDEPVGNDSGKGKSMTDEPITDKQANSSAENEPMSNEQEERDGFVLPETLTAPEASGEAIAPPAAS